MSNQMRFACEAMLTPGQKTMVIRLKKSKLFMTV